MKKNVAKISPFVVDPEPIEQAFLPQEGDFEPASAEEKESVVEKHKSVSYWRDAWRRFRANTVSMVALFVFILILLFAFLGPALIPYDYEQQYRTAQKLAPFEFSEEEQKISFALHLRSGVNYANSSENELINENGRYTFANIKENDVPKIYVCAGTGFATEEDVLNHVEFMNEQRVNNGMKPINYDRSLIPVTLQQSQKMRDTVIKPYIEKMGNCEMVLLFCFLYI